MFRLQLLWRPLINMLKRSTALFIFQHLFSVLNYLHEYAAVVIVIVTQSLVLLEQSAGGGIWGFNRPCLNTSRRLNSVVRVLWRASKRSTWFVFRSQNLLSLDTVSSSYLISGLWDIKYTLILSKSVFGDGSEVERVFLSHLEKRFIEIWHRGVDWVLNEKERHAVYLATIMGSINAYVVPTFEHGDPGSCPGIFMTWFKGLERQTFFTWFPFLLNSVSEHIIWSDGSFIDAKTQAWVSICAAVRTVYI